MQRYMSLLRFVPARVVVPCALLLGIATVEARPAAVVGPPGAYVGAQGYGGRWVGGPYRPWVRPGWGGWGYGYPRYGYGWGAGFGYGAGFALATAPYWGWGWPPAYYVAPSWVPATPLVEQVVVEERAPAAPQAAPQQPGYWYYCSEPAGYYPYVNTCSRPWIAVNPTSR